MCKELVSKAISFARDLFSADHGGHDASHTMRVYRIAMEIAKREPGCDFTIVALGALLHDADDHKLFDTTDNTNARRFLNENNLPSEKTEQILQVVNGVSFSRNKGKRPSTLEGCIVQDADRLDAIGAIGIARTFAYGGEHGRSLQDSVQHFYDKLLILKDSMNTDTAKKMAAERHAFLVSFLEQWQRETNEAEKA